MKQLFCDLKTDEEKSNFFLIGRGYETGVIAQAIQNDVAMAYRRCAEYEKEVQALRKDSERLDWLADPTNSIGNVQLPTVCVERNPHSLRDAIDDAMEQQK